MFDDCMSIIDGIAHTLLHPKFDSFCCVHVTQGASAAVNATILLQIFTTAWCEMLATCGWSVAGGFAAMGLFEQRESEEQGGTKKTAACATVIPICGQVVGSWAG